MEARRPNRFRLLTSERERREMRALNGQPASLHAAPPAPTGLTADELRQVQTFVCEKTPQQQQANQDDDDGEVPVCAICLGEMVEGETLASLKCAHKFHLACCSRWLSLSVACPLCKTHALTGRSLDVDVEGSP